MPQPPQSPSSKRIRSIAGAVGFGCTLMAVAVPAYIVFQWGAASPEGLVEARLSPVAADALAADGELESWRRLVGAIGGLVPGLLLSWGLLKAARSLRAIGSGQFFAPEVAEGLSGYALAAFWSAIASFLLTPCLSVALTLPNPPGQRELAVGLSSGQLFSVLGAGIVWIIAAALARGAAMARENEQFV